MYIYVRKYIYIYVRKYIYIYIYIIHIYRIVTSIRTCYLLVDVDTFSGKHVFDKRLNEECLRKILQQNR